MYKWNAAAAVTHDSRDGDTDVGSSEAQPICNSSSNRNGKHSSGSVVGGSNTEPLQQLGMQLITLQSHL
jgi:hypothetical protein